MVASMLVLSACTPTMLRVPAPSSKPAPDTTLRWECPIPGPPYLVDVNDQGKSELPTWNQAQCSPIKPVKI